MAIEYGRLSESAKLDLINSYISRSGATLTEDQIKDSPEFASWAKDELEVIEAWADKRYDNLDYETASNVVNGISSEEYNEFRDSYIAEKEAQKVTEEENVAEDATPVVEEDNVAEDDDQMYSENDLEQRYEEEKLAAAAAQASATEDATPVVEEDNVAEDDDQMYSENDLEQRYEEEKLAAAAAQANTATTSTSEVPEINLDDIQVPNIDIDVDDTPTLGDNQIEEILASIGEYEPKTMSDLNLTTEGLRTMVEQNRLDELMPEQLVAAQEYVNSLGSENGGLAKENEIEVISLDQAKEKLKEPANLTIGELASINAAIEVETAAGREVGEEHTQIRNLMREAISNVAAGRVEVGRDTNAMREILKANVALRSSDEYAEVESRIFEASQQVGIDNEFIGAFRTHESKILDAFSKGEITLEEVEDYPVLRQFIRNCDHQGHTAQEIHSAKSKLANIVKTYDDENGLSAVTKEILEANTTALDAIEASYDPFKIDETKDVPVPEIEAISFEQAKEMLKDPTKLSIANLASIEKAVQSEIKAGRQVDAEHAQIRGLMRDAITGVAKGKVKIGKDVKAMDHILKANAALMTSEVYAKADDKRREALKAIQDDKPLVDEEFTVLRDTMKAMDIRGNMGVMGRKKLGTKAQDEVFDSIMDAAKLKARQSLLGKKGGVNEEDWKNALKDSLHGVLFEVYAADQAAKGNTNQAKIADGFQKLAEKGAKGKKVKINRDSVIGVMAAREHAARNFGTRLTQKLGNTPAVGKFKARVKAFDEKCSKRFGKKYDKAKGAVKWIGKAAWGAAKNYGIYAVATAIAPVGIPALMAYNMGKSAVNLRKDYLKKKEKNPELKLKDYWKSRDALVGLGGVALSAFATAVPAMQFAEGLGIQSVADLAKQSWVTMANAGRPAVAFALAAGPKTFDAIFAKKEERKQKWSEAVGAMGGVISGYLLYGAIGDAVNAASTPSTEVSTPSTEVDGITGAAAKHEVNEGPKYYYDKDDPTKYIIHDDPNQAAFERGEFDAENAAAREAMAKAEAEKAAAANAKDDDIAAHVELPEIEVVAPAIVDQATAEPIINTQTGPFAGEDIVAQYREDALEKHTELMFSNTHGGLEAEHTAPLLEEFNNLKAEGKVDEARDLMEKAYDVNGKGEFEGSEVQKAVDAVLYGTVAVEVNGVEVAYGLENNQIQMYGDVSVERNPDLEAKIIANAPKEGDVINLDGVRSTNPNLLLSDPRISADIQRIQVQDAVYTDMQERQQLGQELKPFEKQFMQQHEKDLSKYGLTHEDVAGRDELGEQARAESLKESQAKAQEEAAAKAAEREALGTKTLEGKDIVEKLSREEIASKANEELKEFAGKDNTTVEQKETVKENKAPIVEEKTISSETKDSKTTETEKRSSSEPKEPTGKEKIEAVRHGKTVEEIKTTPVSKPTTHTQTDTRPPVSRGKDY